MPNRNERLIFNLEQAITYADLTIQRLEIAQAAPFIERIPWLVSGLLALQTKESYVRAALLVSQPSLEGIEENFGIEISGNVLLDDAALQAYEDALEFEAEFYLDRCDKPNVNKYKLFRRITGSDRQVIRTDDPLSVPNVAPGDLLNCAGEVVNGNCVDNIYSPVFGFTAGNVMYDIFGPREYILSNNVYTPKPNTPTTRAAMIADNFLHENVGHWLMWASGMGTRFRSPLFTGFTDQQGRNAITDAGAEVEISWSEITTGTRQNASLNEEEIKADALMFAAKRQTTQLDAIAAIGIRQAMLFYTEPADYYEHLWDTPLPNSMIVTVSVEDGAPTRLFRTTAETVVEDGVCQLDENLQCIEYFDAIYLRDIDGSNARSNSGFPERIPYQAQVTIIGRIPAAIRDYDTFLQSTDLQLRYWLYVGWSWDSGTYRYAWVRQDLLNISSLTIEDINIITFDQVNIYRGYSPDDAFNPPDGDIFDA